jgi:hypothetical protein
MDLDFVQFKLGSRNKFLGEKAVGRTWLVYKLIHIKICMYLQA